MQPTPVLKSAVTITVPINVQAEDGANEIEDEIEEEEPIADIVDDNTSVTEVLQDPVPVVSSTAAPVVSENPILQDDVISQEPTQDVPGQVIRFPCQCRSRQCGCCTGAIMERIRMKACGNISFIPEDFVFDVRMTINNNTVVRRRVSGEN